MSTLSCFQIRNSIFVNNKLYNQSCIFRNPRKWCSQYVLYEMVSSCRGRPPAKSYVRPSWIVFSALSPLSGFGVWTRVAWVWNEDSENSIHAQWINLYGWWIKYIREIPWPSKVVLVSRIADAIWLHPQRLQRFSFYRCTHLEPFSLKFLDCAGRISRYKLDQDSDIVWKGE